MRIADCGFKKDQHPGGIASDAADVLELQEIVESFGLKPIILPDLSALDWQQKKLFSARRRGHEVET